MKRSALRFGFSSVLLILLLTPSFRFAAQPSPTQRHIQDELILRFRPGSDEGRKLSVHSRAGGKRAKVFKILEGLELVKLPPGISVEEGRELYRRNPDVLYAEPNYIVTTTVSPNDPSFSELWALHNVGQLGGTPDADIDAAEAWEISTGSNNVVVAVIDTGIDYNHQDLSPNMFRNPADCNSNGLDDDGNGYVDDCFGIDTVNGDTDPKDDHYHGTHVAGTIGAVGNNNIGVVGINWNVRLMACKFLSAQGSGTTAGAIACLEYVKTMKERGVNIIATNNSWGGGGFSQALFDAINAQSQLGILFIAAAGNGGADLIGDDNDAASFYPSSFYLPNVISVAATTRTDDLTYFSNFGRRTVHMGAPGHQILSTTTGNTYSILSGTSMATPHVTGVAALLKAQNSSWDWRAIKNLILAGGDNINALTTNTVTQKRLNANGALTCSNSVVLSRLKPVPNTIFLQVGNAVDLAVLHINCASPNGNVDVIVTPGSETVTLLDDGIGSGLAAGDGIYSARWSPPGAGIFTLAFPGGEVVTVSVDTPVLSVTPNSLVFGGANIGGSLDKSFTVQNAGSGTLDGSAATSAPYSIVSGGSYHLTNGQSQTVTVRFSPTSTGTFLGNVNFSGGSGASASVSGTGVIPANLTLGSAGKLRDRVGQADSALTADGSLDGTFTATLQAGSGVRVVTSLDLSRGAGRWDTVPGNIFWVLGAASSLDGALLNSSNGVNFSVADGGSFMIFASDWNNTFFNPGDVFTLTAQFGDGSTATAQATFSPPPPPPGLTLSFNSKLRDRVGQADSALTADGSMDGTFTATLQAGSGVRVVTSLDLSRGAGRWDTVSGNAFWALGAASSLDGALLNSSNGSVNFSVADGGSFKLFASDQNNSFFNPGDVFTLTAKFGDGSTATSQVTLPFPPPPPPPLGLTLSFNGKLRDRVGQADSALTADGSLDGTFSASLQAGSGSLVVTSLDLSRGAGHWDTVPGNAFWVLGAASSLDGALLNSSNGSVNFSVADGESFKLFASDQNNNFFNPGDVFTLTAQFGDGSTATGQVTLPPPPPPPGLTLSFNGKLRDRVGQGETALTADGSLDGTFAVTLQAGSGNRTVIQLGLTRSNSSGIIWDTVFGNTYWVLGAASSLDGAHLNSSNGSVNFSLTDGGGFNLFASDKNNSFFSPGEVFTLTTKFGDGSTATALVTIPPPPPGPGLTMSFSGKLRDRVGQGDTALPADGSLDGTFAVTLQAGSGNRTVIRLGLTRTNSSGIIWDTVFGNNYWVLGAASSLDAALLNSSNGSVNFSLTDGGSFNIFAADWNNSLFGAGGSFTLTISFDDGSFSTAIVTITS